MLGALRKRKNSPIITILLGLTALLMIGFGVSLQGLSSAAAVAHVNGEPISELEFNSRYTITFRERQNQDRRYDRTRAEKEGLREQVLNSMMTGKILSQKGAEIGLAIDDKALRNALVEDPRFQTAGRFDKNLYQRTLAYLRTTDRRFETQYREELLARPLTSILTTVGPSEAEVRTRFEREENKVDVSFVQIPKADFAKKVGEITTADIDTWRTSTEDPDAAIEAYYAKNKRKKYDIPKRVCAQHILVRSPEKGPPDERGRHEKKIQEALDKVKAGDDFAAVAKKYSEDNSASTGGDLGCFGPGQMVPPLEQAAFGLEPGKHSGIVKTNFGFHVIKVNKVEDPVQKKLEDVKDEIEKALAEGTKASVLAKAEATKILTAAKDKTDLESAVDPKSTYKVEQSGPFPRGRAFLPKLGAAKEVMEAAWTLTDEKPLPEAPIETDRAWIVMRLKERTEPDESTYEQKRKFIVFQLTREKQEAMLDAWFTDLRKQASTTFDPIVIRYDEEARNIRASRRSM